MRKHTYIQRILVNAALFLAAGFASLQPAWSSSSFLYGDEYYDDYDPANPFPFSTDIHVDNAGNALFLRFHQSQLPIVWVMNDQGIPGLSQAASSTALVESMNRWNDVPESSFAWNYGGTVTDTIAQADNVHLLTFADLPLFSLLPTGVLGVTIFTQVTHAPDSLSLDGRILDVDIVFSPIPFWDASKTTPANLVNVQYVSCHEMGHALGLSHVPNGGSLMYPYYDDTAIALPFPFIDDQSIVSAMYPQEPLLTNNFGTVSGHVYDEQGGPVWGAVVTLVRQDGSQDVDAHDALCAFTLLDGSYIFRRVPPGSYWVQMGPAISLGEILGNTQSGSYGSYAADSPFNLVNSSRLPVGMVFQRKDYATEFYDNQPEPAANTPPPAATVLNVGAGQTLRDIDFSLGFAKPLISEEEPNNTFAEAMPLDVKQLVKGHIDPVPAGINPDVDFFVVNVREGDFVIASATATTPLSPLLPGVTLYDSEFAVVGSAASGGSVTTLRYRSTRDQQVFAKITDYRGIGFGGPEYAYTFGIAFATTHALPEGTNLLSVAKGPAAQDSQTVAVVGLDLVDTYGDGYGDAYIDKVVVRFRNYSGRQIITPADLEPLTADALSGLSLWRDANGDGSFNYTAGGRNDDDEVIPLRDFIAIQEPDGFTVELYPQLAPDGTGSRARLPGSPDGGRFDFFLSVRTSDLMQHGETFVVDIPPGGLSIIDQFTPYLVNPDYALPDLPQSLVCDIVNYVVYTDPRNVDNFDFPLPAGFFAYPLEVGKPEVIFGINTWGNKGEGYKISKVVLTLRDILDFEPEDLAILDNSETSGVSLYIDRPGSTDGVFDIQADEHVTLKFPETRIRKAFDAGGTYYEVVLVPETPLEVPDTDLDSQQTKNADFFMVLRLSNLVRDGDVLRVELATRDQGAVVLSNGQSTRRVLNTSTIPMAHELRISPQPAVSYTSLVAPGDTIARESRNRPVIGINVQDYGAHYNISSFDTKIWYDWVMDSLKVDFLDAGVPGNFTSDDLRGMDGDVDIDAFWGEPNGGVNLFRDDNTPLAAALSGVGNFDVDGDGRYGEEILNNMDDDLDALTDEDVGDYDEAGTQGTFDELDDVIPYTLGYLFTTDGGTTLNRFVTGPTLTNFSSGNGFAVTFTARIQRRELHWCGADYVPDGFLLAANVDSRSDLLADRLYAYHILLTDQGPMFYRGFDTLWAVQSCASRALTILSNQLIPNAIPVPHNNNQPDDPCNHQVVPTANPPCTNRVAGRPVFRLTYVHGIEFPDDDYAGGPNDGDDFYITIRTSPYVANGDDFAVRIAEGGIRFSRYEWPGLFDLSPKSSPNSITTPVLRADVKIKSRFSDQTVQDELVSPGALDADPLELFALNVDLGGSLEGPQPGVSPEGISGFVLEIFSPAGTPANQKIVISNDSAVSQLNPIAPGPNSGVLFYQDNLQGRGRDGVIDFAIDPIIDVKADPQITGDGTVDNPYRIKIDLDHTVPVYYDDYTGQGQFSNGNDYYIALRASSNMRPGTRFVARIRAQNFYATTGFDPIGPTFAQSNVIRAAVPVQILPRIESQREIEDANLSPQVVAFAFNMQDGGSRQKLDSVRVQLIPVQPNKFPASAAAGQSTRQYTLPGHPVQIVVVGQANLGQNDALTVSSGAAAGAVFNGPQAGGFNVTVNGDTVVLALTNATGGAFFQVTDVREAGQPVIPRSANSEFTLSDLLAIASSAASGLALYKDVNVGPLSQNAVFDVSDELVPILPPTLPPSTLDVTLKFAKEQPDVPDGDAGLDSGADYFLVFRPSSSINIGDAFAVSIPSNGMAFVSADTQVTSPATNSTAVVWANRRYAPALEITRPLTPLEPGDPQYTIQWSDSDPDNDGPVVALYYIPESEIGQPTATRTLIVENLPAALDGVADRFDWTTLGLPRGEYRIIGIIQDNAGNVVEATSPGTILLASDVANITFTAPSATQSDEQRTAIGGRYRILWQDQDQDDNARLRLFWDTDVTPDDPRGVQVNFITGNFPITDRNNSFSWTLPVSVLEQYPQVYVGYVETDPDLDLPIIRYADAPIIIRAATPGVSVDYALNLNDPEALREALAKQVIPVVYTANDIDSNGADTAQVNLYWVDASLIGPATGQVTLALLDQLAAQGQYLRSPLRQSAVDLPEDAANGGMLFDWDISVVPSGTYGIIATVTDRQILSDADLVYATAPTFINIPALRFPARFPTQRFEQSSALATDLFGSGQTQTVLMSKSGRLLILTRSGLHAGNDDLLPTDDSGQVVSSPAAGDFDRNRPGNELVVGVGGTFGPSLLYIAADAGGGQPATQLLVLDDSPLKPGVDSTPAVGDLNGDGELDVVVKLRNGKVVALAGDGQGHLAPLWSVDSAAQPTSGLDGSPAIGNVLGDSDLEVVVGTADSQLLVIETLPALKVTSLFKAPQLNGVTPQVVSSPALRDVDGDGLDEIFIGVATSLRGALYGLNGDATSVDTLSVVTKAGLLPGTVLAVSDVPDAAPAKSLYPIRVSPAFGDVNGDGTPDLVFASERYLYAYSFRPAQRTADLLFYFAAPVVANSAGFSDSSPILADLVTTEGAQEIVIGSDNQLFILSYVNGQVKDSQIMSDPGLQQRLAFDLSSPDRIATTPVIADAVGDPEGRLELVLVVASSSGGLIDALMGFDGTLAANRNVSWPMLKSGPSRTARYGETESKASLPFDLNKDGVLDYRDVILFSLSWSVGGAGDAASSGPSQGDWNHSGRVDADDLQMLIDIWKRF